MIFSYSCGQMVKHQWASNASDERKAEAQNTVSWGIKERHVVLFMFTVANRPELVTIKTRDGAILTNTMTYESTYTHFFNTVCKHFQFNFIVLDFWWLSDPSFYYFFAGMKQNVESNKKTCPSWRARKWLQQQERSRDFKSKTLYSHRSRFDRVWSWRTWWEILYLVFS